MRLCDTAITLSLPYNHDERYAEWLDLCHEGASEVYLPVHPSIGPTARAWAGPESPSAYHDELRSLAKVLARRGLSANIVLNMPIWSAGRSEVIPELARMMELFGDDTEATFTDFPLARDAHAELPELHIGVSSAVRIESAEAARYWVEDVGARTVVLGREINKRPDLIRAIRQLGVRIKAVLDDCCVPNCPAQVSHASLMTQSSSDVSQLAPCFMQDDRDRRPWMLAQKDFVPAELPHFDGLIDIAKLDGRSDTLASLHRRRKLFLEAVSLDHPKRLYRQPPDALEKIVACDRDCAACKWCELNFEWPVPKRSRSGAATAPDERR